jgi:hypothetical protein
MKLIEQIEAFTILARKGPAVIERDAGTMRITEILDMPHVDRATPEAIQVDVHFAVVLVDPQASKFREKVIAAIEASPLDLERLRGGPSYIELGAALGDQGLALRLLGLGQVIDLWRVITPATFGLEGPEADNAAGMGYVMASGYHPESPLIPATTP